MATGLYITDGRRLLFCRAPLDETSGPPGVWLLEVETRSQREIVTPDYRPAWLPWLLSGK